MNEIFGTLVTILVVWLLDLLLPGIKIDNFLWLIAVCLVIALVNFFIKPLVEMISLPINIITFGIFKIVINSLMVYITAWILPGFTIDAWYYAAIFALVYYSTTSFLHSFDI